MTETTSLDIPKDTHIRTNKNVVPSILRDLINHAISLDEAAEAIEHLMIVDRVHTLGRTKAGNDIGSI